MLLTGRRSSVPPADTSTRELAGQLHNISHTFENADGTKTIIGRLAEGQTISGTVDDADELVTGGHYLFLGTWTEHERHGWQFKFTSFCRDVPRGPDGIESYLILWCEGIGLATAGKLVKAYGADAVRMLMEAPSRIVDDGLLRATVAEAASASLREVADPRTRDTHLSLFRLFRENGITIRRKLIPKCLVHGGRIL
jgi:hypothetical protein